METTRIPWALRDHAGNQLAELDDDDVTVVGGPQNGARYRQIEIELTGDSPDDGALSAVADSLRHAGAEPDDQPKLAKALGLSTGRPDRRGAKGLRTATSADVVRYATCSGLQRLLDHDYRLRLQCDDPHGQDVHQARVATRRLRSNLQTFRPLLDPIWLKHTEDELRWMGTVLGTVRDADVISASLRSTGSTQVQPPGCDSVAELRTKLAAERVKAVMGLGEALGSQRYLDLLDRLHAATSQPPLISGSDNGRGPLPASKLMPRLVRRRWRRMEKKVATAGKSPSAEELHRIRIAAKNLRYACELSQPVIGKAAKRTAKLAEGVQTVLGDYHDASALIDWLTGVGTTGPGRGAFAAGVLIAEQDVRRRKLAKRWRHQWTELARPASRRWLT
jgi:CHAD domain-containing protein